MSKRLNRLALKSDSPCASVFRPLFFLKHLHSSKKRLYLLHCAAGIPDRDPTLSPKLRHRRHGRLGCISYGAFQLFMMVKKYASVWPREGSLGPRIPPLGPCIPRISSWCELPVISSQFHFLRVFPKFLAKWNNLKGRKAFWCPF